MCLKQITMFITCPLDLKKKSSQNFAKFPRTHAWPIRKAIPENTS